MAKKIEDVEMSVSNEKVDYFERYEGFFQPDHPELGEEPLPIGPYISEEHYKKEKNHIFSNSWFKVGHESQIPKEGDYFVREIPVIDASIIIVRGKDGVVRGFHNVCTHRANQLEPQHAKGCKGVFVCPFHSWTFNLDGSLRGVPESDRFIGLDNSERGLTPVSIEVWKGFIFLNPQVKPEQNLLEYLGRLGEQLSDYPFENLRMIGSWETTLHANWKVLVDAFQEGYHVMTVHKNTVPTMYSSAKSGHNRITHFKTHGKHRSFSASKNPNFVPTSIEALAFKLGASAFQRGLKQGEVLWPGLNPGGEPAESWAFDVNVLFPSTFIDVSQGFCFTYEFYPEGVNQTRFEAKLYVTKPETWGEYIGQDFLKVHLRESLMEDLYVIESTQRGLESGAVKDIFPSDQEIAIRHHYKAVMDLTG